MFYVTRDFVCERLKVSRWASYGIVPSTAIGRIPSDDVVSVLNRSRKADRDVLDYVPSDILTPDEASELTGIPANVLLRWTRRSVKVPPHFRINKQTTRFRRESLENWLRRNTRG